MPVDLQPPLEREVPSTVLAKIQTELRLPGRDAAARRGTRRRRAVGVSVAAAALVFTALGYSGAFDSTIGKLRDSGKSPKSVAAEIRKDWESSLQSAASETPDVVFPNLADSELRTRLATAAQTYGFRVRDVTILRPRQAAPAIVVESKSPADLVPQVPAIMRSLDPKAPGEDREGWTYEGFFFEVVDSSGSPALVVTNGWRPPNAGGTQWAAPGIPLPYEHL
jgi:hypothetical protein